MNLRSAKLCSIGPAERASPASSLIKLLFSIFARVHMNIMNSEISYFESKYRLLDTIPPDPLYYSNLDMFSIQFLL